MAQAEMALSFSPYAETYVPRGNRIYTDYYQHICALPHHRNISAEELRLLHYKESYLFVPPEATAWPRFPARLDMCDWILPPSLSQVLMSPILAVRVGKGEDELTFHVHETALLKSSVLAANVRRENWNNPRGSRQLDLPYDDPHLFERLLEYLYSGDFEPRSVVVLEKEILPLSSRGLLCDIESLVDLCCMADKYGLPELRSQALKKISRLVPSAKIFVDLCCMADEYDLDELRVQSLKKISLTIPSVEKFVALMEYAYDEIDDEGTRLCAFKECAEEYFQQNHEELSTSAAIKNLIMDGGELAWDCHSFLQKAAARDIDDSVQQDKTLVLRSSSSG